ncbi:MAG: DEAD/DEAH box helicase, partial [Acidobacteriota bacterium]
PIAGGDASVALRLRQRLQPFVLRRLKRDVAPELPPRTELVRRCELAAGERALYDAVQLATRADVIEQLQAGGNPMHALEALLRLRQVCCHAALVPGSGVPAAATSAKLSLLLELLEVAAADGHKSLVFTQWTSLLDLVEPWLKSAGIPFVRLDGSTQNRGAVVAQFQSVDGPPVMLLSLKAGGVGLNLTAADHVFLLDPWWNPAAEDQAADRAHRIGQDKPVFVTRLIAADTVEERVLALQQSKRAIAEAALGTKGALTALSRDELLTLLGA